MTSHSTESSESDREVNVAGYHTSGQMYSHERKVCENTAHKYDPAIFYIQALMQCDHVLLS